MNTLPEISMSTVKGLYNLGKNSLVRETRIMMLLNYFVIRSRNKIGRTAEQRVQNAAD